IVRSVAKPHPDWRILALAMAGHAAETLLVEGVDSRSVADATTDCDAHYGPAAVCRDDHAGGMRSVGRAYVCRPRVYSPSDLEPDPDVRKQVCGAVVGISVELHLGLGWAVQPASDSRQRAIRRRNQLLLAREQSHGRDTSLHGVALH